MLHWTSPLSELALINNLHEQGQMHKFDPNRFHTEQDGTQGQVKMSTKAKKIIERNQEELKAKQKRTETEKLEALTNQLQTQSPNITIDMLVEWLKRFETDEFLIKGLFIVLKWQLSGKGPLINDLYLVLADKYNKQGGNKELLSLLREVREYLEKTEVDLTYHQMVVAPSLMPPLNPIDNLNKPHQLDPWQKETLGRIRERARLLIVAPTSSGKTACMNYIPTCLKDEERCLYVVPSDVLAKQVAGMYRTSLKGRVALLTNREHFFPDKWRVLVGTPYALENWLQLEKAPSVTFSYVVYDEIQKLNPTEEDYFQESACFERLIRRLRGSPFVALTATIEDPERLRQWFKTLSKEEVELIVHNKRPLLQQLHVATKEGSLVPVSYLDATDIRLDIPLTAPDLYRLYKQYEDVLPEDCDPDEFLPFRITLDDVDKYRSHLLQALQGKALKKTSLPEIGPDTVENRYKLIKELQGKQLLPGLLFTSGEAEALQIYGELVKYLEDQEYRNYPHHREDLNWLRSRWSELMEEVKTKVGSLKPGKGQDSSWVADQKASFIQRAKAILTSEYSVRLQEHIDKEMDKEKRNYYKTLQSREWDPENMDFFAPHTSYSFHTIPLGTTRSKEIRRKLIDQLRTEEGATVDFARFSFDHIFMRGLLRGIVLYHRSLPAPFQMVVQTLVAEGQAPLIISDDSLAYGVNFPIRTVLIGDCTDPIRVHQMMGRSGRRGLDREGHVVFLTSHWQDLLRCNYPPLLGDVHTLNWSTCLLDNHNLELPTLREVALPGYSADSMRDLARRYSQIVDRDEARGLWLLRTFLTKDSASLTELEFHLSQRPYPQSLLYLLSYLDSPSAKQLKSVIQDNALPEGNNALLLSEIRRLGDFLRIFHQTTNCPKLVEGLFQKLKAIWLKYQL